MLIVGYYAINDFLIILEWGIGMHEHYKIMYAWGALLLNNERNS